MSILNAAAKCGRNRGALIVGVYLLGMTTIAGTSYALRGTVLNSPVVSTEISDTLPLPPLAIVQDLPNLNRSVVLEEPASFQNETPQAPRMAGLTPTDILPQDGLVSPLSRVFLGAPKVTPPNRPGLSQPQPQLQSADETQTPADQDTVVQEPAPDAEAEDVVVAGLGVSIRPRLRPDDLPTRTAVDDAVRLASLFVPDSAIEAIEPQTRLRPERVPETPRIASPSARCPKRLARGMPRRKGGAAGASSVLAGVRSVDGVKRDQMVVSELLKGNMPSFQRNLVPVTLSGPTSDGGVANITLCVTPDYLALGSDSDFVRVPLGLDGASRVAKSFNMVLPTPRVVDAIYRQSKTRLSPSPMTPGAQMTSTNYFMRHNDTVEAQRRSAGATHGNLIAGHKKDVVLTTRLASNRGRVAIYGWHRPNGKPIQPLSTVHGAGYADYSHGIRLVSRTAYLNGQEVDLHQIMANPRYAGIISHEGPMGRAVLASN
ncbi:MAG: hypothetical protein AAF665_19420 [Pseudomonadota bacterium]